MIWMECLEDGAMSAEDNLGHQRHARRIAGRLMIHMQPVELLADFLIRLFMNRFNRLPDGVIDRLAVGFPMTNDAYAVHAEQGRSPRFRVIGPALDLAKGLFQEKPRHFRERMRFNLLLNELDQRLGQAFGEFEHDVSDEPVAYHDVHDPFGNVPAFHVAEETRPEMAAKKFGGGQGESIAFGGLFADG